MMTKSVRTEPSQCRLMRAPLAVELVRSTAAFAALGSAWAELLADARANSITLSHDWLYQWWRVFKTGRELCLLLVRESSGRLLGIAPLLRRTVAHRGIIPYRRLELLGSGEDEADEIDSDYLDLILRTGHELPVVERLLDYLRTQAPFAWDELILRPLPSDSFTLPLAGKLAETVGLSRSELVRIPGVRLTLPSSWAAFLDTLERKQRYNVVRARRRLQAAGSVRFRWTTDGAEFAADWPRLVELHQKRWAALGQPGCFASSRFRAFHEEVGPRLAETGRARIATLALNGRILAARYLFTDDRCVYAYQSGFDPELDGRWALGKTLQGYAIEAAISEGFQCYDLLKGAGAHKRVWSSEVAEQVALRLCRPGWREPLRAGLEWAAERARSFRRHRLTDSAAETR
jgi:CelD/BcsL family acetyltransferase involved in cellulose biosynthesis